MKKLLLIALLPSYIVTMSNITTMDYKEATTKLLNASFFAGLGLVGYSFAKNFTADALNSDAIYMEDEDQINYKGFYEELVKEEAMRPILEEKLINNNQNYKKTLTDFALSEKNLWNKISLNRVENKEIEKNIEGFSNTFRNINTTIKKSEYKTSAKKYFLSGIVLSTISAIAGYFHFKIDQKV